MESSRALQHSEFPCVQCYSGMLVFFLLVLFSESLTLPFFIAVLFLAIIVTACLLSLLVCFCHCPWHRDTALICNALFIRDQKKKALRHTVELLLETRDARRSCFFARCELCASTTFRCLAWSADVFANNGGTTPDFAKSVGANTETLGEYFSCCSSLADRCCLSKVVVGH